MSENRLRLEKSPYLLQHQHNPVHWYAWGDEAFQAAKRENKPIFLSIGYSTCHWCHVMERESFEIQEVADVLNRYFISIKVDREERPDVDDIYMSAVHAMRQRGGWPLSMFLTPELKPFFGGTYWPKAQFIPILEHLAKLWREDPAKIEESGESLVEYLRAQKSTELPDVELSQEVFRRFYGNSLVNFDRRWGGFGAAPKFPHAMQISMLLRIHRRTGDEVALQMVSHTLDKMARGGMYDHLGGGFARYSTDERWLVPHFEKMLYDNALLVVSYLEAFQVTQNKSFAAVAREILDYVLRDMTDAQGGFYSAEDADSEGEEGKFYVWSYDELKNILSAEEFARLCQVYSVTPQGNFEHSTNILYLADEFSWFEKDSEVIKSAREKLFKIREQRVHPYKDDKVLTSWNGLMIRAMALGYRVLGDERYLQAAHRAVQFLQKNLLKDESLLARYREGEGRFAARLEDYAFLISGLIELYQCDFNPEILSWALRLQTLQDRDFWDGQAGAYFYTDGKDPSLLVRGKEGMDGALPNANAVSALNLLKLHGFMGEEELRIRALAVFKAFSSLFSEYPHAFSQMLIAYDYFDEGGQELAMMGTVTDPNVAEFIEKFRKNFWPNLLLSQSPEAADFPPLLQSRHRLNGQATFYLCQNQSCQAPTNSLEAVIEGLDLSRSYSLGSSS